MFVQDGHYCVYIGFFAFFMFLMAILLINRTVDSKYHVVVILPPMKHSGNISTVNCAGWYWCYQSNMHCDLFVDFVVYFSFPPCYICLVRILSSI